jgi:Skp family chaperone for outer membrane proteins
MRIFHVLLLAFLLNSPLATILVAQNSLPPSPDQCIIGFYDQDSIALRMKGFRPLHDSVTVLRAHLTDLQNQQFVATDRLLRLTPSDSTAAVPAQTSNEIAEAKKEVAALNKRMTAAQQNIDAYVAKHIQPYYSKIAKAADTVSQRRKLTAAWEINAIPKLPCASDQTIMIDLSRDIAVQLGITYYAFRVGIFNRDSLLRLMPGCTAILDSFNVERRKLDSTLAPYNRAITDKQRELDSLRPKLSKRNIAQREKEIQDLTDQRDELRGWQLLAIDNKEGERLKPYNARLNSALLEVKKEQNCRHLFEHTMFIPWTSEEVEYVDINPFVAERLLK